MRSHIKQLLERNRAGGGGDGERERKEGREGEKEKKRIALRAKQEVNILEEDFPVLKVNETSDCREFRRIFKHVSGTLEPKMELIG